VYKKTKNKNSATERAKREESSRELKNKKGCHCWSSMETQG
jgi:hypothetical protein